jgi:hypothetical protein
LPQLCMNLRSMMRVAVPSSLPEDTSVRGAGTRSVAGQQHNSGCVAEPQGACCSDCVCEGAGHGQFLLLVLCLLVLCQPAHLLLCLLMPSACWCCACCCCLVPAWLTFCNSNVVVWVGPQLSQPACAWCVSGCALLLVVVVRLWGCKCNQCTLKCNEVRKLGLR